MQLTWRFNGKIYNYRSCSWSGHLTAEVKLQNMKLQKLHLRRRSSNCGAAGLQQGGAGKEQGGGEGGRPWRATQGYKLALNVSYSKLQVQLFFNNFNFPREKKHLYFLWEGVLLTNNIFSFLFQLWINFLKWKFNFLFFMWWSRLMNIDTTLKERWIVLTFIITVHQNHHD